MSVRRTPWNCSCVARGPGGADLRFGVTVTGLTPRQGGGVVVATTDGVLTAGAWAPQWVADAGIPLVVERRLMHWFDAPDLDGTTRHDITLFDPARL